MRYWTIRITDPATNELLVPNANGKPGFSRISNDSSQRTYSSLNAGASVFTAGGTNMGALQFECDISTGFLHEPLANSFWMLHGVSLQEIGEASDLNFLNCAVYGGMAAGLPLADPAQSGLLTSGQISQALGNWIGTDMTLSAYIWISGSSPTSNQTSGQPSNYSTVPMPTSNLRPANIVFQWRPGEPLMTPLVNTLQTAFPKYSVAGQVSPGLVWSGATATGYFSTLEQFAAYLNQKSISMLQGYAPPTGPGSYPGVCMTLQGNTITVQDGTTQTQPKQINFLDLIGQPTWGQPQQVQVTTVMRADIGCGDYVVLPAGQHTVTQGSQSAYTNGPNAGGGQGGIYATSKDSSIFQSTFQVTAVRHVGSSRGDQGTDWISTLELTQVVASSNAVAALPLQISANNQYLYHTPS